MLSSKSLEWIQGEYQSDINFLWEEETTWTAHLNGIVVVMSARISGTENNNQNGQTGCMGK
jgi:hypothetical protein